MTYIPRAVCEPCRVEFRVIKNGVRAQANTANGPYYKVQCDRYECPKCGHTILRGFAQHPEVISHEPEFNDPNREPDTEFSLL